MRLKTKIYSATLSLALAFLAQNNAAATTPRAVELKQDLLYELLVAHIGINQTTADKQRALTAFMRAAEQTKNAELISQAIPLAVELKDHKRVLKLSNMLNNIAPQEFNHHRALAEAYFASGQKQLGISSIVDLTKQALEDVALQDLIALVAQQPPPIFKQLKIAAAENQNPRLQLLTAQLALRFEDHDTFLENINAALAARDDWELAALLKLNFLSDRDMAAAEAFAKKFLYKNKNNEEFALQFGYALLRDEQLKKSIAQFKRLTRKYPKSPQAWFAAGLAHMQYQDWQAALNNMEKAYALNADAPQTKLFLAELYLHQRDFAAAKKILHTSLPRQYLFRARALWSSYLAHTEGLETALEYLNKLKPKDAEQELVHTTQYELLYRNFDQLQKAKQILDAALNKTPENENLLYRRGLLAAELNLISQLEKDMRALIKINPDNADAYNVLGYTLADKNLRLDEAEELISKALQLRPNSAPILDSMGWLHFRRGNITTAIKYLRRALDGQLNGEMAAHLGEALWVSGRRAAARRVWRRAKKWDAENTVLKETLKRFMP